jgi:L-serine dehydratase
MVGPSSSHTAGACRLALLARHLLPTAPEAARFELHGSFAKTGKGHGTDLALVAGVLGYAPDDERIPHAFAEAERVGLLIDFAMTDLGDVHPNSVRISLRGGGREATLTGSSLGGGFVRVFEVDGFRIEVTGGAPTLLVQHRDTPGVIARVARIIADDDINIGTLHSARRRKGGEAMMSVEMDRPLSAPAAAYLAHLPFVHALHHLPEVMSATSDAAHIGAATAGALP